MYMAYHILLLLPIKYLINEDGKPTKSFKLETGKKPSISYSRVLFFLCCTKSYCTCWGNFVKNASPSEKWFSRYLCLESTALKRVSCSRTTQTQDRILVRCIF